MGILSTPLPPALEPEMWRARAARDPPQPLLKSPGTEKKTLYLTLSVVICFSLVTHCAQGNESTLEEHENTRMSVKISLSDCVRGSRSSCQT